MSDDLLQYLAKRIDDVDKKVDQKFNALDGKIDKLLRFKWQIIGGSVAMSFLITLAFQIIRMIN